MKLAAATALFVSGVVAASTAAAAAHQSQPQPRNGANQPSTFSGSCALSGTVQFQPPLTNTPQTVRDLARARGTCSGTLTDSRGQTRQLNATTVSYFATDAGSEVSCGLTPGATGTGELVFQSAKLCFNLSETRPAAAAERRLNRTRGGS